MPTDGKLALESSEARWRHLQRREADPEGHPEVEIAERHRHLVETATICEAFEIQVSSGQIRLQVAGGQRRPRGGPVLGLGVVGAAGAGGRAGEGGAQEGEEER